MTKPDHEVAIVGAGPGGICAAILLQQKGIDDFVIIDRAHDFGGSWRDNDYPGLAVDVPGFTFQYSFARNPKWSRIFPTGTEVLAYHQDIAREHGLYSRSCWGTEIVREEWDDEVSVWRLHTADGGLISARFVISAIGAFLNAKSDPGIVGLAEFSGEVLRPNHWNHDYDLADKRVAVIGTGASSVQITPSIAPEVERLTVFQRTPVWCLPKPDRAMGPRGHAFMGLPGVGWAANTLMELLAETVFRVAYQTPPALFRVMSPRFDRLACRLFRSYVRRVIDDEGVAEALSPTYGALAKRPTLSNHYLRAFNRPNVELVTDPIERITATGVRTRNGRDIPADALVLATGYEMFSDPESYRIGAVLGRNGFDLATFFHETELQAYQSVSVPGIPNRWILVGPYSWTAGSWHGLVEVTANHAVNVIAHAISSGFAVTEVTLEAHDEYHRMICKRRKNMQYYFTELNAGVNTYYVNSAGDVPYLRPTSYFAAKRQNRNVDMTAYRFHITQGAVHA